MVLRMVEKSVAGKVRERGLSLFHAADVGSRDDASGYEN